MKSFPARVVLCRMLFIWDIEMYSALIESLIGSQVFENLGRMLNGICWTSVQRYIKLHIKKTEKLFFVCSDFQSTLSQVLLYVLWDVAFLNLKEMDLSAKIKFRILEQSNLSIQAMILAFEENFRFPILIHGRLFSEDEVLRKFSTILSYQNSKASRLLVTPCISCVTRCTDEKHLANEYIAEIDQIVWREKIK